MQPSDAENSHTEDIRVVAVELVIERAEDSDGIILTKIGDWAFEGPLQGSSRTHDTLGWLVRRVRRGETERFAVERERLGGWIESSCLL